MYSFLKLLLNASLCGVQCCVFKKIHVFCAGCARGRVGSWISGASAYSFRVGVYFFQMTELNVATMF